jgi:IS30 family transposase
LERNSQATKAWPGGYEPIRAHGLALRRRRWDCRYKLARQPDLRALVQSKLAMGWSPGIIAGRLALEQSSMRISHEAIYRYTYFLSRQKIYWHRYLVRKKHRRGRLGKRGGSSLDTLQHRVSIAERPAHIDTRKHPGHWEADMMAFSHRRQNLLVAHERTSRFTFIAKTPNRQSPVILAKLKRWFSRLPPELRQSLTQDNVLRAELQMESSHDVSGCKTAPAASSRSIQISNKLQSRRLPRVMEKVSSIANTGSRSWLALTVLNTSF